MTFINCGISSSDVFLMNFPIDVNRSASDNKFPAASLRSFIVLNLTTLKMRPFLPGLGCLKNTLPRLAKNSQIATTKNTGNSKQKATPLTKKSMILFKKLRYNCMGF
jgi:hypothetical protein